MKAGVWVTKDGKVLTIAHMSDSHLLNAIQMMNRKVVERSVRDKELAEALDDFGVENFLLTTNSKYKELVREFRTRAERIEAKSAKIALRLLAEPKVEVSSRIDNIGRRIIDLT